MEENKENKKGNFLFDVFIGSKMKYKVYHCYDPSAESKIVGYPIVEKTRIKKDPYNYDLEEDKLIYYTNKDNIKDNKITLAEVKEKVEDYCVELFMEKREEIQLKQEKLEIDQKILENKKKEYKKIFESLCAKDIFLEEKKDKIKRKNYKLKEENEKLKEKVKKLLSIINIPKGQAVLKVSKDPISIKELKEYQYVKKPRIVMNGEFNYIIGQIDDKIEKGKNNEEKKEVKEVNESKSKGIKTKEVPIEEKKRKKRVGGTINRQKKFLKNLQEVKRSFPNRFSSPRVKFPKE